MLVPKVIDLVHYASYPEPEGVFTIGWIGTPPTAEYLELISAPFR